MQNNLKSDAWLVILFAAFHLNMMSCSIYTDSQAGWVGMLYYAKTLTMSAGFFSFSISRRFIKEEFIRRILLMAVNVACSAGLIALMYVKNSAAPVVLGLLVMFLLGYMGGAVYLYVAAGSFSHPRGGLLIAIAASLAYVAHFFLWVLLKQELVMVIVMALAFTAATCIIMGPQQELILLDPLPYSDDNEELKLQNRNSVLLLTGLTAVALLCGSRADSLLLGSYQDLQSAIYGASRLWAIPACLGAGLLFDWKKREALSALLLFILILTAWIPAEPVRGGLLLGILNFTDAFIYAFITMSFMKLAPKSSWPELWASFSRIMMIVNVTAGSLFLFLQQESSGSGFYVSCILSLTAICLVLRSENFRTRQEADRIMLSQKISSPEDDLEHTVFRLSEIYSLTPRETDVIRLVISRPHDSTVDLAASLGISRSMFYRYLSKLYDKTGTESRKELAALKPET